MHRIILKKYDLNPDNMEIDQINRNKLDNRKINLRTVTRRQNEINKGLLKNNKSGYKGVYWDTRLQKWASKIEKDKRVIWLGRYSTIQGAWLARRWGERIYHE